MDAASAWATRLQREAEQGIKPTGDVIDTLRGRIRELEAGQTRLANAGLFGAQYSLAQEKIDLLAGAVETLTAAERSAAPAASDLTTELGRVRIGSSDSFYYAWRARLCRGYSLGFNS